ncbi:LysR family transcriptional regulator [Bifidobacterium sp. 82T24]|uniref:LysR family transcriptional regulator n=1 Tax=Bifidobacterium pluvialisilvae TaxID=2834436 RepID=UPI001C59FD12|nr:LysR family transcriptional regulator [Bifidobacterium pluvialisilvae]MBW3088549.1 LysR family transcriptional regulator [Bifidobacterium pluvialisilvae]
MAELNPQMLVTLWQIERCGSFSAAAKTLGWSQPAISQQIKKLESQCGMQLVTRTARGVELTPAGAMLARHGGAMADELVQAQRQLEDYRRGSFAHLRIVAPPSICSTIVAKTVVRLSIANEKAMRADGSAADGEPGAAANGDHATRRLEISLAQMEPPEAVEQVTSGEADAAVIFRYDTLPHFLRIDDSLRFEPLGADPLRLLVRRSSAIGKAYEQNHEPVDLTAACDEAWIAGCATCRANLFKLAARAGFQPDIRHSTDDYWATQNLVEMGMGVSIVPTLDTKIHVQDDLVACTLRDVDANRQIGILTRVNDTREPLRHLRDELAETARHYLRPFSAGE